MFNRDRSDRRDVFSTARDFFMGREALLLFLAGVVLLLPSIWLETSITGKDEYLLSFRTPMEMMGRHDWLTPWLDGAPRLKKPPLLYWTIASGYKAFGTNLFGARVGSVLFGAAFVAAICLLYREVFRKSGFRAGLIALATIGVATQARMALLDLPLALFSTLAVCCAIKWGRTGGLRWIALSAFSLGLSFLSKGPLCFLFFGTATVCALSVFKKWKFAWRRIGQLAVGLLALLAMCLPWPLMMLYQWSGFLGVIQGEVGGRHYGSLQFVFSALGGATGLVFPWTLVFAASLVHSFRARRDAQRTPVPESRAPGAAECFWLALWFLTSVAPFFFMMSFERYTLPVLPASCLLVAYWLGEVESPLKILLFRISVWLLAATILSFCAFATIFRLGGIWVGASLLVAAVMAASSFSPKRMWQTVFLAAAAFCVALGGLYPRLEINALPPGIENIVGNSPVAVFHSEQPSMLSIRLGRSVICLISGNDPEFQLFKRSGAMVFMKEDDAPEFEAAAGRLGLQVEQTGEFRVFYSEKSWIHFARKGTGVPELETALKSRSLEGLKTVIRYYRIIPVSEASG